MTGAIVPDGAILFLWLKNPEILLTGKSDLPDQKQNEIFPKKEKMSKQEILS